jgi:ribosomal protein L33
MAKANTILIKLTSSTPDTGHFYVDQKNTRTG